MKIELLVKSLVVSQKSPRIKGCTYSQVKCSSKFGEICLEHRIETIPHKFVRKIVFLKGKEIDVVFPSITFSESPMLLTKKLTRWFEEEKGTLEGFKLLTVTVYIQDEDEKCDIDFNIDVEGDGLRPETLRDTLVDVFTKKLTKMKNVKEFSVCH